MMKEFLESTGLVGECGKLLPRHFGPAVDQFGGRSALLSKLNTLKEKLGRLPTIEEYAEHKGGRRRLMKQQRSKKCEQNLNDDVRCG